MARRTKEEALETRDRILDAAELIFESNGVSRTSLQHIAQAAKVTRGAIYWHFKDKADLFTALMERATLPMEAAYKPFDDDDPDPLAFLQRQVADTLRITASNKAVRRAFEISTHKVEYVDELLAVRDRRLECRSECLGTSERILKAAMQRGQIGSRVPTRVLALGLHALMEGLIQNWMLRPDAFDLVRLGRDTVRIYIDGLRQGANTAAPASDTGAPATPKRRQRVASA
jgi:TetR/AcrR family acrAB operon transcriptional repressor